MFVHVLAAVGAEREVLQRRIEGLGADAAFIGWKDGPAVSLKSALEVV